MKTVAVILAGGIGSRMDLSIPKQFMFIEDKPVIVHTIDNFQRNKHVDSIVVVCNNEWIDHMNGLVKDYGLSKVKSVVPGGETAHDSTRNGLYSLKDELSEDDFVIIHDSARPIVPQILIDEMLDVAYRNGNACMAIPCYETIVLTDDKISGTEQMDRDRIMRVQTPQTYRFGTILHLYERCDKENIHDIVYANIVAIRYGERIYFSRGFTNNIKITKKEDIALCESLIRFKEERLL